MERKFHGSESSLYGLFAPGNESAKERKGLESFIVTVYRENHPYTITPLHDRSEVSHSGGRLWITLLAYNICMTGLLFFTA